MIELHASQTVAAKVRELRQQKGWSMRELAARSGMPEDVIEAIENGRRRRGVTVDELMILAHALQTVGMMLLPADADYFTDEQKQRLEEAERQRQAEAPRRKAEWEATMGVLRELPKFMRDLGELFDKIPDDAVIAVERDGQLVPVEEPTHLIDGDAGLRSKYAALDRGDVSPPA